MSAGMASVAGEVKSVIVAECCRSIVSAIIDTEADDTQPTFDEWFKSLPNAKQENLFGVGRAQLFREGRISQLDLLNRAGRPLTLAELRRKAA